MTDDPRWAAVDDWFGGLMIGEDPVLAAALADSDAAGLPTIAVTPAQGKFLALLIGAMGARRVLELGTLGGYSTIWMGRALPADGRLVSLESQPRHAEVARANLARAGLQDVVQVRVGPALEALPMLERDSSGPFDLVFVDADKEHNAEYLDWALRLTHPGSVIIVDNVVRGGGVLEPDHADPRVQGTRRFAERVAAEPRISATTLQTVGGKGWDGFTLALVG